jgi:quinol-cytochrome oxidoreductase complex cytochrome b subunit
MSAGQRSDGFMSALWWALRRPVRQRGTFSFGWLILFVFAVQIVTGILLSLYYEPSPRLAAESVRSIMRDVGFGWLVRGIHHWATGFAQLVRMFISGRYRVARSSWYLGILLFGVVILLAHTGTLLPWDQEAYWSVTRSLEVVETIPLLGPALAPILRGGEGVTGATLGRLYSGHVMFLPWVAFYLLVLHFVFYVRNRSRRKEER